MANFDDMAEDEDACVTKDMLGDVLETRIGGTSKHCDDEEVIGDGRHRNSTDAGALGQGIWSTTCENAGSATQLHFQFEEEKVQRSSQSARSSRDKES